MHICTLHPNYCYATTHFLTFKHTSQMFFLSSLEEIDASTFEAAFTKKKNYLNSNHKGGKNNSPETEEHSHFKFGNSASHFDPSSLFTNSDQFDYGNAGIFSNFVKQSNSQSINKQNWIHRKGYSLPKISSFVSLRDHNIVMSKHQLRQKAIGDVCLPECGVSDVTCNCGKLFTCVEQMDEYDLAVWAGLSSSWVLYYCETDYFSSFIFISLTAGGYVDKTPGSKNYGKFTVSAENVSTKTFWTKLNNIFWHLCWPNYWLYIIVGSIYFR